MKDDYEEAALVLSISPKASAALSRRCLQTILREHGYGQKDLARIMHPQVAKLLNILKRLDFHVRLHFALGQRNEHHTPGGASGSVNSSVMAHNPG